MAKKVFCGVPTQHCQGSLCTVNNGWSWHGDNKLKAAARLHNSSQEAFRCFARHLVARGYTQVGTREFTASADGPVLVIDKKSRFGHKMRGGKSDKKTASRFVPRRHQGCVV